MSKLHPSLIHSVIDKPIDMLDKPTLAAYLSSLISALVGAVTMENVYWLFSLFIAVFVALTNYHFRAREDRRRQERHDLNVTNGNE